MSSHLPVDIVNSGSFIVSKAKGIRLEAFLGTCVGLAVFDRKNQVGGLYHILLPEPMSSSAPGEPLNYARLGLPRFFKALNEAGAELDSMEISTAGGALVGPVSMQDLQLDIGGRTAEIVNKFLSNLNVRVTHSEMGGYFSSRFEMNMSNGEVIIEPIGKPLSDNEPEQINLNEQDIDKAISRVRPIPQIALKIVRMLNSNEVNLKSVADEVRQDQVISAKVINMSNSALFSPRSRIDSVDRALVMLGEKKILQLILFVSVELFYQDAENGYSLCKGGLYHNAIASAVVAEQLARMTNMVEPDVAYTAGLLHDIGKAVLDQYVARAYPFFYRKIFTEQKSLLEAERDLLGVQHTSVGSRLAELWALPESLKQVIAYYHMPEQVTEHSQLVHLVYLSQLLISRFKVGTNISRINTSNLSQRLERLGIGVEDFPDIVDKIPWQSLQLDGMF